MCVKQTDFKSSHKNSCSQNKSSYLQSNNQQVFDFFSSTNVLVVFGCISVCSLIG